MMIAARHKWVRVRVSVRIRDRVRVTVRVRVRDTLYRDLLVTIIVFFCFSFFFSFQTQHTVIKNSLSLHSVSFSVGSLRTHCHLFGRPFFSIIFFGFLEFVITTDPLR